MGKKVRPRPGFWARLRIYFRRFRAAVWTLVLLLLLAVLWLNQLGLPDFLKRPLLEKLRSRGVELEFTQLRLSWSRGFVAYNVRFGAATADPAAPRCSARRVEVPLSSVALRRLDFEIGGLVLADGLITWPNDPALAPLTVTNLNATVRFQPDDAWELENFSARVAGMNVFLNGEVAHASALRDWNFAAAGATNAAPVGTNNPPINWRAQLHSAARTLAEVKFSRPPGLRVSVFGDAREPRSFKFATSFTAAEIVLPWGTLTAPRLTVRSAGFAGQSPLTLLRLRTRLDGGELDLAASLNLVTRALQFHATSDYDFQKIRPALPPKTAKWLGQFSWEKPPHLVATGQLTLPAWTNRLADWPAECVAQLALAGEFRVGHAAFRSIPARAAESHFSYSNAVWRLPDLVVTRPEGRLRVAHWTDERTQDYYWQLRGVFDPAAVAPVLPPEGQRGLAMVRCGTAPEWDAEIWGRWQAPERLGAQARLAASNLVVRGESIGTVRLRATYTNLFLRVLEPEVVRSATERATLAGVGLDFSTMMIYLTNGVSTLEPMVVGRVIGPKTAEAFAPYQFLTPPTAHVDGAISLVTNRLANLHVRLEGGPFRWWKFNVPHIRGDLAWVDQLLKLDDVTLDFYGGHAEGGAEFDLSPAGGRTDFKFDCRFQDTRLGPLMADVANSTNQLEGIIDGRLTVRAAHTESWQSWQGDGEVKLREGLLWEIPAFGVFAPVLNTLWPNLGSGRASAGGATFNITNGVVRTEDLELRSPMLRMQYRGTVDFAGKLDARATAELLRNTWGIGPLVSTVLWPITKALEFKITGDLGQPRAEPLHIPKALLVPFTPIRSIRELFNEKPAATNAPAASPR